MKNIIVNLVYEILVLGVKVNYIKIFEIIDYYIVLYCKDNE